MIHPKKTGPWLSKTNQRRKNRTTKWPTKTKIKHSHKHENIWKKSFDEIQRTISSKDTDTQTTTGKCTNEDRNSKWVYKQSIRHREIYTTNKQYTERNQRNRKRKKFHKVQRKSERISLFQKSAWMKIGIITSWNDTLTLFKFLQRYDHEYIIYYDFLNRPYGDKTHKYSLTQIQKWIWFLLKKWCEKIILPPTYELALLKDKSSANSILPLFETYLRTFCFTHSLVGKIWLFGDYADIQIAQELIKNESKTYKLKENQWKIKKFHFPFDYRSKETSLRKYYLDELSYSDPMINKVIKYDLRYFKDAGIDTAIPLNYGYFNYQNTISKFFNHKKTRFHKLEKLEEIFKQLVWGHCEQSVRHCEQSVAIYSVSLYYTNHCDFLKRNKKLLRLLQRGKEIAIKYEEIK